MPRIRSVEIPGTSLLVVGSCRINTYQSRIIVWVLSINAMSHHADIAFGPFGGPLPKIFKDPISFGIFFPKEGLKTDQEPVPMLSTIVLGGTLRIASHPTGLVILFSRGGVKPLRIEYTSNEFMHPPVTAIKTCMVFFVFPVSANPGNPARFHGLEDSGDVGEEKEQRCMIIRLDIVLYTCVLNDFQLLQEGELTVVREESLPRQHDDHLMHA